MKLAMTAIVLITLHISAVAQASGSKGCSQRMLAGRWVFATDIGHQALPIPVPRGDITAMGTMNFKRNGDLEGAFAATFQDDSFAPRIGYTGKVVVNADCTGTLQFDTELGISRTDSILVLNRWEIWGMSQDPNNLWTYKVRRLPRQ